MQHETKLRAWFLAGLALLATSCGTGSCDGWDNAPRTEYYIEGGAIEYRQAAAAPEPVLDYVSQLMDGRALYMDLWRVDADDSDENYKLRSDYVSSRPGFPFYNGQRLDDGSLMFSGRLVRDGDELQFDIVNIDAGDERFTDLRAWGSCNLSDAQRLIKQVRLPAWHNNVSSDSAEVTWEVAGDFEGEPFSVTFSQVYFGKSRYPVRPYGY